MKIFSSLFLSVGEFYGNFEFMWSKKVNNLVEKKVDNVVRMTFLDYFWFLETENEREMTHSIS